MSNKYDHLVMVTKLCSGEEIVSITLPISEQQFILAFPMVFANKIVIGPWFDYVSNRIFPFSPNDLLFCKAPADWLLSEYLTELFINHPEAVDFMDAAIEKEQGDPVVEMSERVLH